MIVHRDRASATGGLTGLALVGISLIWPTVKRSRGMQRCCLEMVECDVWVCDMLLYW